MFHQTALVFLCISVIYLKMWSLTWQQYFIIKCLESWILSTVRSNPVSLAHWVFLYIWVCLATSVLPVQGTIHQSDGLCLVFIFHSWSVSVRLSQVNPGLTKSASGEELVFLCTPTQLRAWKNIPSVQVSIVVFAISRWKEISFYQLPC